MSEQELDILIHKQLTGQAEDAEAEVFQRWLAESEANATYFQKMAEIWAAGKGLDFTVEPETEAEWQKLRQRIGTPVSEEKPAAKVVRMRTAWGLAAAAVVLLGVALWWMLGRQDGGLTTPVAYSLEKGKIKNVTLPDGSTVALNAGSTLEALQGFGGRERRVKLNGEAFFQVRPNKSKPFIVEADGASVRVVGTSFNVSAYPKSGNVTTTVAEGKVEFSSGKKEKALLTPGMQGRLEKSTGAIATKQIELNEVAAWRQGRLVFDNIPLSEAFEILARRYDVSVKIEGDISGRKIFSAHENEPLGEVLKVLELTYDLDIEQTNDTIFVRNK